MSPLTGGGWDTGKVPLEFCPDPTAHEAVERLRQQNHEYAERRDRQTATLEAEVAQWRNRAARAKEIVRGSPVDWSKDPQSQKPDGWWSYTSQNNRDVLIAAVAALATPTSKP